MGLFGRKRIKSRDAQGRKIVTVVDKRGTVRKTKIKDKKNQITTKERYDRSGNLIKRKAKGKYIKRFKAKTSNPTFDQSVFNDNQTIARTINSVASNPILNAKRTEIVTNGNDNQKKAQNVDTKKVEETKKVDDTKNVDTTKKDDTTKKNDSNDISFSQAYRTQRDKNTAAGIDHYGDDAGYFEWRGKMYNTESKSEKEARLNQGNDDTEVINTDDQTTDTGTTDTGTTTDPTITGENETETTETPDNSEPSDSTVTTPTGTISQELSDSLQNQSDTIQRRGGSSGSYRRYRSGGAVGPNGVL